MTERYAHLAPDHLNDAVANLRFSAHFQHTEKAKTTVLSTVYNVKSTTYAHRSRVYVTGMDWSGHI